VEGASRQRVTEATGGWGGRDAVVVGGMEVVVVVVVVVVMEVVGVVGAVGDGSGGEAAGAGPAGVLVQAARPSVTHMSASQRPVMANPDIRH
jgi:hypothetical protein